MSVKAIPEGYHTITPYIPVENAAALMQFLQNAFQAEVLHHMSSPEGKVLHAELKIGSSMIMVSDATEEFPATTGCYYLYFENCDEVYQQAINAGGTSIREPEDQFYGDRSAGVQDDSGNQWWIATHIKDVSEQEIQQHCTEHGS